MRMEVFKDGESLTDFFFLLDEEKIHDQPT
jgi:hypothetical protein